MKSSLVWHSTFPRETSNPDFYVNFPYFKINTHILIKSLCLNFVIWISPSACNLWKKSQFSLGQLFSICCTIRNGLCIKSCCIPETNVMIYVNYTSIRKKEMNSVPLQRCGRNNVKWRGRKPDPSVRTNSYTSSVSSEPTSHLVLISPLPFRRGLLWSPSGVGWGVRWGWGWGG